MKLSVIIPIYNVERYLRQCLESVVNQTFKDLEIILVDDGSTDSCPQICDEYAKTYNYIKSLHKKNGGVTSAWKAGINEAEGDYISIIDPDDYLEKDFYAVLYDNAQRADADIVIASQFIEEEENGAIVSKENVSTSLTFGVYQDEELEKLKKDYCHKEANFLLMFKWARLYKTKLLLDNISFFDERISLLDEIGITIATLFDARKIAYIDYCGYHYVQHNSSIVHTIKPQVVDGFAHICQNIETICLAKGYCLDNMKYRMQTCLISYISVIAKANSHLKDRVRCLKKLRDMECAKKALKVETSNMSKNDKIKKILFTLKMYILICKLFDIRNRRS